MYKLITLTAFLFLNLFIYGQNCPNENSTKICYISDNNSSGTNTDNQTINIAQTWTKWFTVKNNGATACPPSTANSTCNAVNYTLRIFSVTRNGTTYSQAGLNAISYPTFTVNKNVNGYCSMSCSFTQSGTYFFTYDVIHSNGNALAVLSSGRMNATVIVNAPVTCTVPTTPSTPTSNSPQCNQVTITRGTPPTGITWYWQGTNSNGTSTTNSSSTYTATTSGTYYLRAYNAANGGCWSTGSQSINVTVNQPPTVTAGSNSPVTAPNAINLTATTTAGATYAWTGPNSFTSTQQNPTINPTNTAMSGNYYVTATLNGCLSNQAFTNVVVNGNNSCTTPAIPNVSLNNPSPGCGSVTVSYSGTPTTGIQWYWQGTAIGVNMSNSSNQTTVNSNLTVHLRAYNPANGGCWSNGTVNTLVTVNPKPVVNPTSNSPVTAPNALTLFANPSFSGCSFNWTKTTGNNAWTSTDQNPIRNPTIVGHSGSYCVTATKNGCASDPVCTPVSILPAVCFPTQNGNGLPTLLYPLAADPSDYGSSHGTWGFFNWGVNWLSDNNYRCNGERKFHNGLDLHYPNNLDALGKNVIAAYDGKVKLVYDAGQGWGQGVIIEHIFNGLAFTTTYIHIKPDPHFVNNGSYDFVVHQGDIIGTVAKLTQKNHLHFNIRSGSYNQIAKRGALPSIEDSNPCHCHFSNYTDPIFPENFIDPGLANYIFSGRNQQHFTLQAIKSKLSVGTISLKRIGWSDYYLTGFTDESGVSSLKFSNPLKVGDSIKVTAANAATTVFAITSEMIVNSKIEIPFIQASNNDKIAHADVKIQQSNLVTSQSSIQLKVTADNLIKYQIGKTFGDSIIYTNHLAQDSVINIILQDTGRNYLHINLLSNLDTIKYLKYIDYSPTPLNNYQIFLNTDTTSENSLLYVDDQYIKKLQIGTNVLSLYNGLHNLRIVKQNFVDSIFNVSNSATININLLPLAVGNPLDSVMLNLDSNIPHYWERGITVQKTNNSNSIISIKGYYDSYASLNLKPISNTYFIRNLTTSIINLEIAALTKRNVTKSRDSVYLLMNRNGSFSKNILLANEYDAENQKFAIGTILNQSIGLVINKRQYPVILNPTITMYQGETKSFSISKFVQDPDSIKNDISVISNNLNFTTQGNTITITAPLNGNSTSLNLSATHDFLTISKDFTIKLLPPKMFMPTAFTPNGDGKNDLLKPLYFGKLNSCKFILFNRYGQKVFETTDCTQSWDGKVKGLLQNTGTYVWTISYQFEGEEIKEEKGTVTLIR